MRSQLFYLIYFSLACCVLQGCKNQLVSDGQIQTSSKLSVIDTQSNVTLYTYFNGYPEILDLLSPIKNGEIPIDRNTRLLPPKNNFGGTTPAWFHSDRTKPTKYVPVDMFVKVYNENSNGKDKYFEAPVLGEHPTPTNITTALSWILRWSFDKKVIRISSNQFDSLIESISLSCVDCENKTNSEVVEMILNSSFLPAKILEAVNEANKLPAPALNFTSLNYQPPDVDFVWSNLRITPNWTFHDNDEINEPSASSSSPSINFNVVLVNPLQSDILKRPSSWDHKVKNELVDGEVYIQQNDILGTPLQYAVDNDSSGHHVFTSKYTDTTSRPLTLYFKINDVSIAPNCLASGVVTVRANKQIVLDLDKTIIPKISPNSALDRLTAINVAVNNMNNLPTLSAARTYTMTFAKVSNAVSYTITRAISGTVGTVNITPNPKTYISGQLISFFDDQARYSLFVNGDPENNDTITFITPYESSSTKRFYENFGCMDPDAWKVASNIEYQGKNFPAGANINKDTGRLTWMTRTSSYNPISTLASPTTSLTITVYDKNTHDSRDISIPVLVTEDHLPQFCALPKLVDNLGNLSDGSSPLVASSNSATLALQVCSGTAPTFTPTSGLTTTDNGYLREMTTLNQTLYFSDEDGDAFRVTISKETAPIAPTLSINNNTLWNGLNFTAGASTTAMQTYDWDFKAAPSQINSTSSMIITSGTVKVVFKAQYVDTPSTTINTSMITSFAMTVHIENSIDSPVIAATSTNLTICGGVCNANATNLNRAKSRYRPMAPNGTIDTRTIRNTSTDTAYTPQPESAPIFEGEIATLELPLVAKLTGTSSSTPVLYSFTTTPNSNASINLDTRSCKFAEAGRIKFEEAKCVGSISTTNDCIRAYLNYNITTNAQDPLPYNASTGTNDFSCAIKLTAFNKDFPGAAGTEIGTYNIYVQNKNIGAPYLAASPLPTEIIDGTKYPKEGKTFDLAPLLKNLFADSDMGSSVASAPVIISPLPCGAACTTEIMNLNATGWNINKNTSSTLIASVASAASNKKVYFETAHISTPATWSQISNIRQTETGTVLQLTSVDGKVLFENAYVDTSGNTYWVSATTNVKNLFTNALVSSTTTAGHFLFTGTTSQTEFRARLEPAASGSASATLISNYFFNSSAVASSTSAVDVMKFSFRADPTTSASTALIFNTIIPTFNSYISSNGTDKYIIPLQPFQVIRAMVSATAAMSTAAAPVVTLNMLNNTNSERKNLNLACWYSSDTGTTFTPCSNAASPITLQASIYTSLGNMNWIPGFNVAADGSTSTTNPLSSGYIIKIRAYDKGFSNNITNLNPLTNACFADADKTTAIPGLNDFSCQDINLDLKVVETMQLPITTILTAPNTPASLGSSNTTVSAGVISNDPRKTKVIVNINENWASTSTPAPEGFFKLHIKPASNHAIDIPDSFLLEVTEPSETDVILLPGSNDKRIDPDFWPFPSTTNPSGVSYTFTGTTPREFLLRFKRNSIDSIANPLPEKHGGYTIKIRYFKNGDQIGNDPEPQTITIIPTFN